MVHLFSNNLGFNPYTPGIMIVSFIFETLNKNGSIGQRLPYSLLCSIEPLKKILKTTLRNTYKRAFSSTLINIFSYHMDITARSSSFDFVNFSWKQAGESNSNFL